MASNGLPIFHDFLFVMPSGVWEEEEQNMSTTRTPALGGLVCFKSIVKYDTDVGSLVPDVRLSGKLGSPTFTRILLMRLL